MTTTTTTPAPSLSELNHLLKPAFLVSTETGYWGRGETLAKAAEQCRKEGAGIRDRAFATLILSYKPEEVRITASGMSERPFESLHFQIGRASVGAFLKS